MTLEEQITQMQTGMIKDIPQDMLDRLMSGNAEVMGRSLESNALKVGDTMPDVVLPSHDGTTINLKDRLQKTNLVISFYRGTWCPYCSLEMKALVDHCDEFKAAGAELVAISPELPDHSMEMIEKESIQFPVMSDVGNKVAMTFGLTFNLPQGLQEVYKEFGFSLVEKNGDDSWELPMPATYVVNQQGEIVYAFVSADYTQRAEPADILTALKTI